MNALPGMGDKHESSASLRAARTASDVRSPHQGGNPQVKRLLHLPPFDDLSVTVGREMRERRDRITALVAVGGASRPAASMIFGHAENGLHAIKAILLATLGR